AALGTAMQATAAAIQRFVAAAEAEAAQALLDAPTASDGAAGGVAASALPLQQQLQQLLQALDSDDPDHVERVLHGLAPALPVAMATELTQLVESFSFREAEAKVRRWQADAIQ
ncbi:hypothetical protein, partial [Xanthomonas translucens]